MKLDYLSQKKAFVVVCEKDDEQDVVKQIVYENDITDKRLHHEIYMSDARKVAPEKWKTVIRHPIRKL